GSGLAQDAGHVGGLSGRLDDEFGDVLADAVVGHAALDLDTGGRHVGELHGGVGSGEDRFRKVGADLVPVDVEGSHELDVADVVAAQVDVHEAWHEVLGRRFPGVGDALNGRGRAVADPDHRDPDLAVAAAMTVGFLHSCTPLRVVV